MLEANYYVPKKDSREHFIISAIIISVLSRGLVKSVTELFVIIINSDETDPPILLIIFYSMFYFMFFFIYFSSLFYYFIQNSFNCLCHPRKTKNSP